MKSKHLAVVTEHCGEESFFFLIPFTSQEWREMRMPLSRKLHILAHLLSLDERVYHETALPTNK